MHASGKEITGMVDVGVFSEDAYSVRQIKGNGHRSSAYLVCREGRHRSKRLLEAGINAPAEQPLFSQHVCIPAAAKRARWAAAHVALARIAVGGAQN